MAGSHVATNTVPVPHSPHIPPTHSSSIPDPLSLNPISARATVASSSSSPNPPFPAAAVLSSSGQPQPAPPPPLPANHLHPTTPSSPLNQPTPSLLNPNSEPPPDPLPPPINTSSSLPPQPPPPYSTIISDFPPLQHPNHPLSVPVVRSSNLLVAVPAKGSGPPPPQKSYAQAARQSRGPGFIKSHASDVESFARLPRTGVNIICGSREGAPSFSFVSSDLPKVEELYANALVMRFHGGRPSLENSHKEICSWGIEHLFSIGPLTSRAFLLRFQDNTDLLKVLTRPSSNLITFPYKIFRWHNLCHLKEDAWLFLFVSLYLSTAAMLYSRVP